MTFDPTNLKPERKQPWLCKEAEERDVHGGHRLYTCYWHGNFVEINSPCYFCEYFRPKEAAR
jgi:hypothetical protein